MIINIANSHWLNHQKRYKSTHRKQPWTDPTIKIEKPTTWNKCGRWSSPSEICNFSTQRTLRA